MPPDEHDLDRADRLAEIDEWLTDLEPGCDGWYIPTRLVRWLRDTLTASEREGLALSDYLNDLSIENARLRAQINGTVDD